MDSVGEGEGGKIWENGIEICKISCMKWRILKIFKEVYFFFLWRGYSYLIADGFVT